MQTECCECDRQAVGFWGLYAYCKEHREDARRKAPWDHTCPACGAEQNAQVLWRGEACITCKKSKKRAGGAW